MKSLSSIVGACLSAALLTSCGGTNIGVPTRDATGSGTPQLRGLANERTLTQETVIYGFQGGTDGANPYAGLLAGKNGDFYGTTFQGGSGPSGGYGTVFKVSSAGSESVLYTFQGNNDGASPQAGVIAGKKGMLYGDTDYGGAGNTNCINTGCGTVFELVPKGAGYSERVLYAFQDGSDGAYPIGTLLIDKSGALYGTTAAGGGATACTYGCGIVFKLTPTGSIYHETVLYRFQGGSDGASGADALIVDNKGALYGETFEGGSGTACTGGCGTVFKLTPAGSSYTEQVLYSFQGGTTDGAKPRTALLLGKSGALYGATTRGGPKNDGAVFELSPSGSAYSERVLYFFKGGKGGAVPTDENGLYIDAGGALYGTTSKGGAGPSGGNGIVFKLTPAGSAYTESVLHKFQGGTDGVTPYGSVIADAAGLLYGTTFGGGSGTCTGSVVGCGTVFKVSP